MDCVEDVNTCAEPSLCWGGPANFGTYTRRTRTTDRAAMYHTAW